MRRLRRMGGEHVRSTAGSFGFRLTATLLVTVSVLGIVRYQVMAATIEASVQEEVLESIQRQGDALADSYRAHEERDMSLMMARAIMDGMARDPATAEVLLLGPDGTLVLGAHPTGEEVAGHAEESHAGEPHAGEAHPDTAPADRIHDRIHTAANVAATGAAAVSESSNHADYEFSVPVDLPGGTHVLHVGQNRSVIDDRLAEARMQSLLLVLVGLPLGCAVFFLAGGWSLLRRHRQAVDRSTRDALTGLGNHRGFQEDLRRALGRADRLGDPLACALVDIDNFKALNDQAGHSFGDEVLMKVAEELSATRAGDGAFRIGGDEFAVLMEPATAEEAASTMERIRLGIAARLSNVTVSVGIADADRGETNPDELLARADAALYEAKSSGRNRLVMFHDQLWESQTVSPSEQRGLERIIADQEVVVALQPIFDLGRPQPIGFEALARFPDEDVFAGPAEVFAVAHRTGQVHELDALCRRAAFRAGIDVVDTASLFVNVAPEVFSAGAALAEVLFAEVTDAGLSPERVVIEVTEQRIVDPLQLAAAARALRRKGFRVALDDVGAGNAGLELLRLMELDLIKIDRSVIVGAVDSGPARSVLMAILAFARESGCHVIAEGIETDETFTFVNGVSLDGVDPQPPPIHGAQGYLLGRPVVRRADASVAVATL